MPRSKNSIPSYRLHKASGQAVVTLGGRDYYLGKHDTKASREAYEREVIAWKAHGDEPRRGVAQLTIAALVVAYLEHVEKAGLYMKHGKRTSEHSCLAVALRPLVRLFAGTPAAAFGPRDLATVRRALCDPQPAPKAGEKRRRVHVGPIVRASVNKHVHRIRRVFRWAASMQLVPTATWSGLCTLDPLRRGQAAEVKESARVRPAPLRDVVAVLRRAGATVAALIRLQWLTGARPGEVVQMRMGDIDTTRSVWIYRPGSHKNEHRDHEREVMLGPKAQHVLAPFLSLDRSAYLFPGRARKTGRPHVSEAAYAKAISRICAENSIAHWTPHQLRHNAGTRFRKAQGLEAARTMLGHSDIGTTLIYAEADRQKASDLAARIG